MQNLSLERYFRAGLVKIKEKGRGGLIHSDHLAEISDPSSQSYSQGLEDLLHGALRRYSSCPDASLARTRPYLSLPGAREASL